MPASKVFFADLRASFKENLPDKVVRVMDRGGIRQIVPPRGLVAVKLHFGEKGNTAFVRPVFVRRIVEKIRELGAHPFLSDTNTLYAGTRSDSVAHFTTAVENGFAYSVVQAPLIIADGLRGASCEEVALDAGTLRTAYLAKEIVAADALLSVAHFKGHELTGFGGAIKNLGMGCAARRGKLVQHSSMAPKVKRRKCVNCGECLPHCAHGAIREKEGKAAIEAQKCVGCGECLLVCPEGAITIRWDKDIPAFQKRMAEYARAVLQVKPGRVFCLNFLTDISPGCDCHGHNDAPVVQDIGFLASLDPVAIDQASADLVNREDPARGAALREPGGAGSDKFRLLYPKVDWEIQLRHAEEIGLGNRQYSLIQV